MNVQKLTHEVRLQQWEKIVTECRNSGKTITAWCAENNINTKTYYHWQKLVCQATCQELSLVKEPKPQTVIDMVDNSPIFAELSMPDSRANKLAVAFKYNDVQINIYCGADAATVEAAMAAIRNLC
jgi:thiamine biosynthesis protein ThiC